MITRPPARRSRRGSRRRTPTVWFNIGSVPATVVAGLKIVFDLLPVSELPAALLAGSTVLRMIGKYTILNQTDNVNVFGAYAVAVVTRAALAAGSVPEPIGDLVDWYYHDGFNVRQEVNRDTREVTFDIRTARRIRGEDRTLMAICENSSASVSSLVFYTSMRLLMSRS